MAEYKLTPTYSRLDGKAKFKLLVEYGDKPPRAFMRGDIQAKLSHQFRPFLKFKHSQGKPVLRLRGVRNEDLSTYLI